MFTRQPYKYDLHKQKRLSYPQSDNQNTTKIATSTKHTKIYSSQLFIINQLAVLLNTGTPNKYSE